MAMSNYQKRKRTSSKKKPYSRKRTKTTKKSYKSSSKGYKKKSLMAKPKRMGSTHWLSYSNPGYFKGVNNTALKNTLRGQGFKAYNVNSTLQMTATAGVQTIGTICAIYDLADISAANNSLTTKHLLRSALVKIAMTNQCNASCFVDIYDVQARQDVYAASSTDITTSTWLDPTQAAYYGSSLFQHQQFVETFKINRVTSLNLAAGETAEHRVSIKPDHLFKDDTIGANIFKGLTRFVCYVIRGPASDNSSNEALVGSLRAKVDVIVSKEYRLQAVTTATNSFARGALLDTTADKVMELDGDETTLISA